MTTTASGASAVGAPTGNAAAAGTDWQRTPGSQVAIERSIAIAAPPERVFALVGDVSRSPEWAGSGEVRAIQRLDTGPIGVGTRYRSDQNVRGLKYHTTSTITAYAPNHLIVWRVEPPTYTRSEWGFRLEPEGSGTRLSHWYDADLPKRFPARLWLRLVMRLLNRRAELARHIEITLQNIKQMAESG